jgi:phage shock protein A
MDKFNKLVNKIKKREKEFEGYNKLAKGYKDALKDCLMYAERIKELNNEL